MWLIEENAMSLRNFVTFNPPKAPTREEERAARVIKEVRLRLRVKQEIRNIGAIF